MAWACCPFFAPSWTIPKTYPYHPPASASSLRAGVSSHLQLRSVWSRAREMFCALSAWGGSQAGAAVLLSGCACSLDSYGGAAGGVCTGRTGNTTPSAVWLLFRAWLTLSCASEVLGGLIEEMLAGFSCTTGVSYSDSLDNIQVLSLLFFCIPACSCLPCVGPTCIGIILSLELDALTQSTALIAVLQSDLSFYFILVDNPLSMWSHWRFKFYSFPKCVLRSSEVLLTYKLVLVIQTYIPMIFFFLSATFPSGCSETWFWEGLWPCVIVPSFGL